MSILLIGQRNNLISTQPSLQRLQLLQIKKLKVYRQTKYRQQLNKQINMKKLREKHYKMMDLQLQRKLLQQYQDDMVLRIRKLYQRRGQNVRFKTQADWPQHSDMYLERSDFKPSLQFDNNNNTHINKVQLNNAVNNHATLQPKGKYISSFQLYNNHHKPNYNRSERLQNLDSIRNERYNSSFDTIHYKQLSNYYNKKIDDIYDRARKYSIQKGYDKDNNNYHYNSISAAGKNTFSKESHNPEEGDRGMVRLPSIDNQRSQLQSEISWREWFSKQKQRQLQSNYKNVLIDNQFRRKFDNHRY